METILEAQATSTSSTSSTSSHDSKKLEAIFNSQQQGAHRAKQRDVHQRRALLQEMHDLIIARKQDIREAIRSDFRKPSAEVDMTEIYPMTGEIKHTIKHLARWMKPCRVAPPLTMLGTRSEIMYEPKGRVLILAPWNFPFQLAMGPAISAIAAGNAIILKPSEFTPATSKLIAEMVSQLFDPEEFSVVNGDHTVASALTALPFDHIFFTGSPNVGKKVMTAAAQNLSTVTLELGGKSPVFVDKDANLNEAASKIAWGKCMNNGQTCIAPDYALVHEDVKDAFMEKVKTQVETFYGTEDELRVTDDYARIINERNYKRLCQLIDDSVAEGAKVAAGNLRHEPDCFLSPTVLDAVSFRMPIMQEEIFGPILPIITYSDLDDAIEQVNNLPKPLALYVFTKNRARAQHVIANTSAGGTCVNDVVAHYMNMNLPFGGTNNSGFGNAHGFFGFKAFSHERSVMKNYLGFSAVQLFFPPYKKSLQRLIDLTIKWL